MSKDSIVVLTHMAWAAIVVSAHKVFSGPPIKMWHCSSTLEPNNILYLSDYQIIHSILVVI